MSKSIAEYIPFFDETTDQQLQTKIEYYHHNGKYIPKYIGEFWTSKQRQANSIHEVSYRACFKPQLPHFFIELLTKENDVILDPFSGRGTTAIEASLMNRRFINSDINPLSKILAKPRVNPPFLNEVEQRLNHIDLSFKTECDIDLSMFYHNDTLNEICNLRKYFISNELDYIDDWIRMVATNRLTGHSSGFFSVWTMPPNQAVSQESQKKINQKKKQIPTYRNVKEIILKKSKQLQANIMYNQRDELKSISQKSLFLTADATNLSEINDGYVNLTVTSPPFLNIVQYDQDNWLRCWFNDIDINEVSKNIVMAKTTEDWKTFINKVFMELYRVTINNGYVAFEVGEVSHGKINLEEIVVDVGINHGFDCTAIMINSQKFTKTSNIWGINNNTDGTNSNRIIIFNKNIDSSKLSNIKEINSIFLK